MYTVICTTQGKLYDLLNFNDEELIIYDAKLTMEMNKAGTFEFTILKQHPYYNMIYPLITEVKIYQDGEWLYTGRVCDESKDFYTCKTIYCEGILSYLCDSRVRPYTWDGTATDYIKMLVEEHNNHVESKKKFAIGQLLSDNSQIQSKSMTFPTTMDEIQNNLVVGKGLHIEAEEREGVIHLNCTKTILRENSQQISFGENVLDLEEQISGTAVKTVMIGIGGDNKNNVPIYSVVENAEAIAIFGRIEGIKELTDITDSAELERLTQESLKNVLELSRTIEVMAIDLNMINQEIEKLRLGYVNIESVPHGIEGKMILTKITKYLTEPEKDVFTLGWEGKFYTEHMREEMHKRNNIATGSSADIQIMTKEELENILT